MGELSLDGGLQSIKGALPIAVKAREEGFKGIILPKQNAREALWAPPNQQMLHSPPSDHDIGQWKSPSDGINIRLAQILRKP